MKKVSLLISALVAMFLAMDGFAPLHHPKPPKPQPTPISSSAIYRCQATVCLPGGLPRTLPAPPPMRRLPSSLPSHLPVHR
jgi:hypothetical protein